MSAQRCERAWQAEAREDGRLSGAELASFARHASGCAACSDELEAIGQLRDLGALLPDGARTPLEVRRLRHSLLRRANQEIVGERPTAGRRYVVLGAAVLCCAAIAFVFLAQRSLPTRAPARLARTPFYRLEPSPDARVRTLEHDDVVRVRLERGRLFVSVDALGPAQRFMVELVDGELEVTKARIVVIADASGAAAVQVIEGRTLLRLHGQAERALAEGERWSREPSPIARDAGQHEAAATSEPPLRKLRTPRSQAPRQPSEFTRGMVAFSAGDYGHADTLFLDFIRAHPDDPRVEDAMFLRAVGHARRGDRSAAAAAARVYLRAYPGGLRRPDAERLLDEPYEL